MTKPHIGFNSAKPLDPPVVVETYKIHPLALHDFMVETMQTVGCGCWIRTSVSRA